jgi:hypothetical protein
MLCLSVSNTCFLSFPHGCKYRDQTIWLIGVLQLNTVKGLLIGTARWRTPARVWYFWPLSSEGRFLNARSKPFIDQLQIKRRRTWQISRWRKWQINGLRVWIGPVVFLTKNKRPTVTRLAVHEITAGHCMNHTLPDYSNFEPRTDEQPDTEELLCC